MQLDVPTLMVVGAFVATLMSAFLLFIWWLYRDTPASLWWSGASAAMAMGIILLAAGAANADPLIFRTGLLLMGISAALTWTGTRSFGKRPALLIASCGGPLVWALSQIIPATTFTPLLSTTLHATMLLTYYGLAAWELLRVQESGLNARKPLAVLIIVHAITQLFAILGSLSTSLQPNQIPPVLSWFGMIHFETLLFLTGSALFLAVLIRERSEQKHADAAQTDLLTTLLNRRGFFIHAERALDLCKRSELPATVAVFDLDHFKTINDQFGHAMGDRTLQVFGQTCNLVLRPTDISGRIGGEEFAILLPGANERSGFVTAERLRHAFAQAAAIIDETPVGATISGGIATGGNMLISLDELLGLADGCLYQAKSRGRDQVVDIGTDIQTASLRKVVRFAKRHGTK